MSSDNYVSVKRVIDVLSQYHVDDMYIREMNEAEVTLLWKNPKTGGFVYAGTLNLFDGKIQGGLILDND